MIISWIYLHSYERDYCHVWMRANVVCYGSWQSESVRPTVNGKNQDMASVFISPWLCVSYVLHTPFETWCRNARFYCKGSPLIWTLSGRCWPFDPVVCSSVLFSTQPPASKHGRYDTRAWHCQCGKPSPKSSFLHEHVPYFDCRCFLFWKCGMDSVFFATGCPRRDVGSHRHRDGYGCNSTDTRIIEHGLPTRRTDPLLSVTAPLTIRAVSGVFDSSPLPCFASPGGVSASGCCSRCRAEAPRCQWHQTDDRGVQLLHRRGAAVSRATADASTPSLWSSRYDSCCRRGDIVQRPSYIIGLSRKGRTRSVLIILKIVNFMTHICPWLLKSLCEI